MIISYLIPEALGGVISFGTYRSIYHIIWRVLTMSYSSTPHSKECFYIATRVSLQLGLDPSVASGDSYFT